MDTENNIKDENLNWADKEALCKLWQSSPGMTRTKFCKQRNLSTATFYRWCKKLGIDKHRKDTDKKVNWFPVNVPKQNNTHNKSTEIILIELLLPNNILAKMNIGTNTIVNLIKDLSYANTVIR